jgi:hypothetical protein
MHNTYRDYAAMCPEFRQGIVLLVEGEHEQALDAFARAKLEIGHRREAIQAIRRGLDIDATHPDLVRLRQRLGVRRNLTFSCLDRDNPINRIIGKLTYGSPLRCFV